MEQNKLAQVLDILDKLQFFQGSRAGRELWFDKPTEVQEADISNFNRDINIIRDYIKGKDNELIDTILKKLDGMQFLNIDDSWNMGYNQALLHVTRYIKKEFKDGRND